MTAAQSQANISKPDVVVILVATMLDVEAKYHNVLRLLDGGV
jgi:hypothetical protein